MVDEDEKSELNDESEKDDMSEEMYDDDYKKQLKYEYIITISFWLSIH